MKTTKTEKDYYPYSRVNDLGWAEIGLEIDKNIHEIFERKNFIEVAISEINIGEYLDNNTGTLLKSCYEIKSKYTKTGTPYLIQLKPEYFTVHTEY